MTRFPTLRAALLMAVLAVAPLPAAAENDQAEISLWQAVTARGLKSDYEGYLLLYPNGRFAPLARLRAAATPPDGARTQPGQAHAPVAGDFSLYHLDVTPPVAGQGQPVTVRCRGFLPPALFDLIVVVRAGAPDLSPDGTPDDKQILVKGLAHLFDVERAGIGIPALPAGAYEVRYLFRQYNPDGRMEVMARSGLTIQ